MHLGRALLGDLRCTQHLEGDLLVSSAARGGGASFGYGQLPVDLSDFAQSIKNASHRHAPASAANQCAVDIPQNDRKHRLTEKDRSYENGPW